MSQNKGGQFFLVLFGMIFLAVGGVMGFFSLRTLIRAEAMRTWCETPAKVVACELKASRGSKGGSTYCVSAKYRYEANRVGLTGDRVSLHTGSDNIGQFHQRLYAELKRCMDRNEDTVCWVNPQNPADVILIRQPRPEMLIFMQIFVLAFGGAGLSIVLVGLAGLLQPSALAEPSAGQGQIRMRGVSTCRVAGVLAVAWNAYVGYFLWKTCLVIGPAAMPWYLWMVAVPGLIPAVIAGYLIGRFRKFGVSVFEMSPLPGVLGGPVSGTVRIPAKVETEAGFEMVLQCIHQYTSGTGKQRSTHHDVLWEDARHLDGMLSYGEETMLPVRFAVPYEKPASTSDGNRNGHYWRLNVTAAAPGIDYKAVFDVPVRHTSQSSFTFVPQETPDSTAVQAPLEDVISRASLRLERQPDGVFELIFPAARGWLSILPLAVFVTVWTGACYVLWTVARAPVIMAVVFTLLDVLVVVCLCNALLVSRGVIVDRARRECVVWWRVLFFPKRERRIPFDAVIDIRSERSGQSGDTVYYRVVMVTGGGRPETVGSGIKMWKDAEGVAKLLRAAMEPGFMLEGFRV